MLTFRVKIDIESLFTQKRRRRRRSKIKRKREYSYLSCFLLNKRQKKTEEEEEETRKLFDGNKKIPRKLEIRKYGMILTFPSLVHFYQTSMYNKRIDSSLTITGLSKDKLIA